MSLFGEPPIQAAKLAEILRRDPDLTWDSLKHVLYRLGKEDDNYVVSCTLKAHSIQGWLLDLAWFEKDTLAMKLAVEDERCKKDKAIKDDFEKLVSVKAPLKLFIYNTDKRV